MKCLLLVCLFSVFCNSQELYSFIENYEKGATVKYKEDSIWSFEVAGNITENGMTSTKTIKCLGFKLFWEPLTVLKPSLKNLRS